MKKVLSVPFIFCLFMTLIACKADTSPIVGIWKTNTPIFGTETDLYEISIIFYDGLEGEEQQTKSDGNRTYVTNYPFDYQLTDDVLTIHAGSDTLNYTVAFSKENNTDFMTLTADDGTIYSYTRSGRTTPGIHS